MSLTSGEHGGDEAVRAEARGGGGGAGSDSSRPRRPREGPQGWWDTTLGFKAGAT